MSQTLEEIETGIAPATPVSADEIRSAAAHRAKPDILIVLDDDPTGTQSVHNLPVLTSWQVDDFLWALKKNPAAIYVLTNSRSLPPEDAARINREVISAAEAAAGITGQNLTYVSRSDSTLRGHFPLETDTITEELHRRGKPVNGVVLVPSFGQAGRITVNGTHYAGSEKTGYVPAAETEFAGDATFGYKNSYLPAWVEEKTGGRIPAKSVSIIDLNTLRTNLPLVVSHLLNANNGQVIVCDSVDENDLRRLSLALIAAEQQGLNFVYRVGPPFVRAKIGQEIKAPLTVDEVQATRRPKVNAAGGLVVVGSHVSLTTRQIEVLRQRVPATFVEIDVRTVISAEARAAYLELITDKVVAGLQQGTTILATSRDLIRGKDETDSLRIARDVSSFVIEVVEAVMAISQPHFVIAKGGITSSDVATKGLKIRRATVVGPMLPGIVSLWTPEEGPATGIPYIVFAGNVGDDQSVADVVEKLTTTP